MTGQQWTPEREQRLRELHPTGMSFSLMAADIGGVTRNACIGKAARIGLKPRGKSSQPQVRQPSRPRVRYAFHQIRTPRKPPTLTTIPEEVSKNPVTFMGLTKFTCRWPISGDTASLLFCGDDKKGPFPYCAHHCRMAHEPARRISEARQEAAAKRFTYEPAPIPSIVPEDFAA